MILVLFILLKFIRAYTGPLARVPGPWYSRFTDLWIKKQVITGRRMHYIHDLHKKYGHVVRLGPAEIGISSLEGFQEIHKISNGYLKAEWYSRFREGADDIFALIDPKLHSAKRRVMARPFSNTSLRQNWESRVEEIVKAAVQKIKHDAMQGDADVFKWWTMMTTDVIGLVAFGETFDMVRFGKDLERAAVGDGIRAEFTLLYDFIRRISFGALKYLDDASARVFDHAVKVVLNANDRGLGKENIFGGILEQAEKENARWSNFSVANEAMNLIVAGSGTTAVTLTYLIWAVLSRPEMQKKLEQEVAGLPETFNDTDLEKLPYLNAVIQESLRLYGPLPGSLPRAVPQGKILDVGGYKIPSGTTVCTQAYTIHRDPDIFTCPDEFLPNRFLDYQNLPQRQKAALSPFGAGSRTCIGQHLALMEMRHAGAHFFRECAGAKMSNSMSNENMELMQFFLAMPKGPTCDITLT